MPKRPGSGSVRDLPPSPLELRWRPRPDDHVAAFTALRRQSHLMARLQITALLLAAGATGGLCFGRFEAATALMAAALVVATTAVALPVVQRIAAHEYLRRRPELSEPISLVALWGQNLTVAASGRRASYAWSEVRQIMDMPRHRVLFLSDGTVVAIPVRALSGRAASATKDLP